MGKHAMGKLGTDNSIWIMRVHNLLRAGFGVEDIAVKLGCSVKGVRAEVRILRAEGVFKEWYRNAKT